MDLIVSATDCARTFLHHRRRRSDDLPVLLRVAQTRGCHAATGRDCKVDAPVFSNEFYPIFLGLMQLCVVERCHRAESHFEQTCFAFFVDGPSCWQWYAALTVRSSWRISTNNVSLQSQKLRENFSSRRWVLASAVLFLRGFATPCLSG